ncbi:MAG: FAD-dependent oxidoreductase [Candidatus Eisenbacteria bacterium]
MSPPPPARLRPQLGTSVKYLAHVKRRFWVPEGLSQYSFADAETGLTWEATDAQTGDENVVHTSFSSAEIANRHRSRSTAERDAVMIEQMERIYPGYRDNFVASRFMDWPSDPWVGGAYSFPGPGQITAMGPVLHEGFPRLHFAGEHTCYKFVGYMEGGLSSGAELARRLAIRDGVVRA